MKRPTLFSQLLHRASSQRRRRGAILRRFDKQVGFVYFGNISQHDDDESTILGFTASLTHDDAHYSVGTFEDYDVRIVDRFDIIKVANAAHRQLWTIIEVSLKTSGQPHIAFVPTGREAGEYSRLFSTYSHLLPLNSMVAAYHHSPELHGRYQILARTTFAREVERMFDSPAIVSVGAHFWPHGIEVHRGKLYVYLTQSDLTVPVLGAALQSSVWLAELIDKRTE
jgi:hypothetical protein